MIHCGYLFTEANSVECRRFQPVKMSTLLWMVYKITSYHTISYHIMAKFGYPKQANLERKIILLEFTQLGPLAYLTMSDHWNHMKQENCGWKVSKVNQTAVLGCSSEGFVNYIFKPCDYGSENVPVTQKNELWLMLVSLGSYKLAISSIDCWIKHTLIILDPSPGMLYTSSTHR